MQPHQIIAFAAQIHSALPLTNNIGFQNSTTPLMSEDVGPSVDIVFTRQEYDVVEKREKIDASFVSPCGELEDFVDDVIEGRETIDSSFVSSWGEVEDFDEEGREEFDSSFVSNKKLHVWEEGDVQRREDVDEVEGREKIDTSFVSLCREVDDFDDGVVDDEERKEFDSSFVSNKKLTVSKEVEEDDSQRREDVDESFVAEKELRRQGSKQAGLMNENGALFLEEMDENVLSNRILELSRTNKIRSAMEYFRSMELFGLCPNIHACNSLLLGLLRNGWFDDCFKVFDYVKAKSVTTGHTYSLILMACAKAQGCDSALKFFRKLERECDVKKDFDVVVYNTMISTCKEVDNWSEIERLWSSMKANGCAATLVTYQLLISSFVHCNQSELALYAYHDMVQNGFEPNNNILNSVICVCAKDGKWDDALSVFQKMLMSDLKPNLVACNVLINSLGRVGELKLAFQVYNTMKSLSVKPDAYTYNSLLSSLNKANRHGEALQLYDWIERNQMSEFNKHLYNTALMSCSKLRLWDKALEILWQMEASGLSDLTVSYNLVIRTCELARKPTIAWEVYEHMVHQKCSPNIFTYLSIIRCCTRGDLYEELEEILNKAVPNAALYNAAVQGMSLCGKVDLAKEIYTKMLEHGLEPDVKTRVLMRAMKRK
ncbi:pentatricopeptide repeat-containing protein At3g29290 isoform X2 [Cicer arietinum]|uniref:Pentatricopeptide repeat-containing protein At3g29290 isoform X2 n=1 Tax=Cicer arietinum TaxID=3827 RepID=A0A3Q7X5D1_CICAR|nr:pentatricopeptide repeat-containing protein At3g29290 isoform X2 [Cicer arietinum]